VERLYLMVVFMIVAPLSFIEEVVVWRKSPKETYDTLKSLAQRIWYL
jgi:hypothetical protein